MSRRPNTSRRFADSGSIPFVGALHPKSRPSPLLSVGLVVVGALLIVGYLYHGSGGRSSNIAALNRLDEPYELDDADGNCRSLVHKGIVRVADIKFPLPYKAKSFSLVIVSDAVDYLSPRYLNKTVPELARVASDGLVILSGYPGHQRAKVAELSKFGRPAKFRSSSWWVKFFIQNGLEENETAIKKFEQAAAKKSYKPSCQVFHLKSLH
ncbi:UNVERIFIED_CONTAM: putative pectin methylesterase CGR3 [Sesamum calycinum]|uniref:Pectin methylesterase CGR3 n=1 Tax=Sesamum calycinum TaxID=2727403 RepID=A0AAW2PRA5_9LAMI